MMTLKLFEFRRFLLIVLSINWTVLRFIQMSSSDDEAQSPNLGASSSQDPPPPLESESSDEDDELQIPKSKNLTSVLVLSGEKCFVCQRVLMQPWERMRWEDSRMVRLPGHMPGPTDVGLWKLKSEYMVDDGRTIVRWCYCPMAYRFGCKCQIK